MAVCNVLEYCRSPCCATGKWEDSFQCIGSENLTSQIVGNKIAFLSFTVFCLFLSQMSGAERIENKCIKDKKNSSGNYICPPQQLLLLLSHFSCDRLCATPEMAAYQAPPSLGFSRQEHRSGLPFPSPMHESEK